MKFIFFLIIMGVLGYAFTHVVPSETRAHALDLIGARTFFTETAPVYLRKKLSIPEDPVAQRKKLINELSQSLTRAKTELQKTSVGIQSAPTTASQMSAAEIRASIAKTESLLSESTLIANKIEAVNANQNVIAKTADRVLDSVFPPATTSPTVCIPEK